MTSKPIRVAIVEDHSGYRAVIAELVENAAGLLLVGVFSELRGAIDTIADSDVVLMDIGLPGMNGIEGVVAVKHRNPSVRVIMVTNYSDDERVFQAIAAGADGYLLKKSSTAKILDAIADTMQGGVVMAPFVARRVLEVMKLEVPRPVRGSGVSDGTAESPLSDREREVLHFLVEGGNYRSIAEKLFLSPDTVRNHIRNIYEKLHVHSRSEAVAKAIRNDLL